MSNVRTKDTKHESLLRRYIQELGYVEENGGEAALPFRPDIVLPNEKIAIFMHGCFWHRHPRCRLAYEVNEEKYPDWPVKFTANIARDKRDLNYLKNQNWRALVVWECALNANKRRAEYLPEIKAWLEGEEQFGEIPGTPPLPSN